MTAEIDSLVVAPTPVQDHVWWRRIDRRTPVRPGIRMPWVDRAASSAAVPDPMVAHEFAIECVAVTPETPGITSFTFRRRDGVALGFRPGQYLNVAFPVDPDGGLRERNYSLSSSPFDPSAFRLTIQREDTGAVSRWAHEHVRPGTALEALGPLGGFHLPDVDRRARYLLLAGGVGITPLISMARTLHALDGTADVVVLYHASTPRDFAFARELRISTRPTRASPSASASAIAPPRSGGVSRAGSARSPSTRSFRMPAAAGSTPAALRDTSNAQRPRSRRWASHRSRSSPSASTTRRRSRGPNSRKRLSRRRRSAR